MAVARRKPGPRGIRHALAAEQRMSLCETLDRVLSKGVVIVGHIVISIADVDLIYVGLNVLVSSVETMQNTQRGSPSGTRPQEAYHAVR